MDDMTLRFIYDLKQNPYDCDTVKKLAIKSMSVQTETPIEYYKDYQLDSIAQMIFRDYISTCDNPSFELWQLFDCYNRGKDLTLALLSTMQLTQVRDIKGFVNGFRELKNNEEDM